MGMPISSYSVLSTLALGGESYEQEAVKQALAPFSLYAFIIHDPAEHQLFAQHLAEFFDWYDHTTGDKLLFFALIDPPQAWLAHAAPREYYQQLQQWEARELTSPKQAPQSYDRTITAHALATALGISSEHLPCIVVTHSFTGRDFVGFQTDETLIEAQLTELGYIAQRHIPATPLPEALELFLRHHSRNLFSTQIKQDVSALTQSLAKTLSDVLSFTVVVDKATNSSQVMQDKAFRQAKRSINELYHQLVRIKHSATDDAATQLEQLSLHILSVFALLNQNQSASLERFIPIDPMHLESDSYQILRTAYKVYELLLSDQERRVEEILEQTNDYSPGVIALAKVFEKEINLSLVQWLRQYRGVRLPDYFARYQSGKTVKVDDVNLNNHRAGLWLPPELGKSKFAFRTVAFTENRLPPAWNLQNAHQLLDHWDTIHKKRNDAAHDRVLMPNDLETVKNSFTQLATQGYFRKFYELKVTLRGAGVT